MTVQKKKAFGRILRHRLDAAKLFPNLGEKGKDFTDYIQGATGSKEELARHAERIRLSLVTK